MQDYLGHFIVKADSPTRGGTFLLACISLRCASTSYSPCDEALLRTWRLPELTRRVRCHQTLAPLPLIIDFARLCATTVWLPLRHVWVANVIRPKTPDEMGQTSSRTRRASDSSIAPLNSALSVRELPHRHRLFFPHGTSAVNFSSSSLSPCALLEEADAASITRPAPPPSLHRVSELIDPHDLITSSMDGPCRPRSQYHGTPVMTHRAAPDLHKCLPPLIESPSGNVLGAQEFLAHPNRPLAIRERQESIRRVLEEAQADAMQEEETEKIRPHSWVRKEAKRSISSSIHTYFGENVEAKGLGLGKDQKAHVRLLDAEEKESRRCSSCF